MRAFPARRLINICTAQTHYNTVNLSYSLTLKGVSYVITMLTNQWALY